MRRQRPISYIITAAVLLLALVLVLAKTGVLPIFNSNSNPSSSIAQPFTEKFQTNDRNWTNGTIGYLTASINGQYTLQINNASGNGDTYFPHPSIGTLPDKFTLTVTMEQTQGDGSYGLAFHESENANGGVSCYALVIHTNGTYQVLKYGPNLQNGYTMLGQSTSPAIKAGPNQFNTLQVIVKGSTFSFSINDQPLSGTITPDTAYSGGQLAVMVSGTNASFVVKQVTLMTP